MSGNRREGRATLDFFHDLDRQLRSERGPNGEPSTSDFQTFELLDIVEKFAIDFDDLPALIPGRDDYRILISIGRIVRAYAVVGQVSADGAVELVSLDLDTDQNWS
ncbi:hypothetical protein BH24ACT5_BH24ACT5_14950 [soil metagenome]